MPIIDTMELPNNVSDPIEPNIEVEPSAAGEPEHILPNPEQAEQGPAQQAPQQLEQQRSRYTCTVCELGYGFKRSLVRHQRLDHGIHSSVRV